MVIRGDFRTVPVDINIAQNLSGQGWRWSGHSHPGMTRTVLAPSRLIELYYNSLKIKHTVQL